MADLDVSDLQETGEMFRALATAARDAVILIDPEGRVVYWNPAAERIFGHTGSEAVGKDAHALLAPPRFREAYTRGLAQFGQSGQGPVPGQTLELAALRKDGTEFPIELSVSAVHLHGRSCALVLARDITERRQAEKPLRESEEQFRQIADHIRAVIWLSTPDLSQVLYVNPAFETVWGLPRQAVYENPMSWFEAVHPDDRPRMLVALQQHAQGTYEAEYRIVRPDAAVRWIRARGCPIRDAAGCLLRMVGIAEDVTEQRKAEDALRHARYDLELRVHERTADLAKANAALSAETAERERAMQTLRESENTYRVLVENLPQKIFLKDRNSVYVSSNHNYALDLRTPPDDLRGRTDYDFYPPELAEKYRADDRRVMESGQTEEMDEGYLQDGQERVVHTVKTPVRDEQGRVTGVLGIFWDVTERKRAEDALRESEERFRATFEQAAVGIAHVAPDGHLLRVNQRFCDIVGYSLGELLRKTFQDITHPDDLDADLAYLRRMLAGQISTYVAERRYVRKDGSIVWSDLTVALVREPSGKPKYFISVVEDIGARKRADEQIRAALEEKTVLLREVHHRVKNNLQAIISLLRIRGAQIGDPAVRQLLIQVQEQARTMSLVYEQLYQSRNLARVQMADYLRILSSNVLRAFGGRQDIDLSVDADGVVMDAQTAMPCGLIVNELVTNALKHAFPPGFVGRPAIGVELRREEARFVLKVVDNGIGLPAGLDRQNLATMGLHLVDLWATHQLGGTLQVDSGQGTAFTATFEESAKATE